MNSLNQVSAYRQTCRGRYESTCRAPVPSIGSLREPIEGTRPEMVGWLSGVPSKVAYGHLCTFARTWLCRRTCTPTPGGHDVAPHRLWPARSGTEADHAAGECGEAEVDPDAGEHGALAPLALRRLGCGGSLLVAAGQPCSVKSRACHVGVHEHCSAAIPAVRVLGRRGRASAAPSSLAARLSSAAPTLGHSPGQASRPQRSVPDRCGVAAETVVAARSGVGAVDTTGTLRAIRAAADGPRNCQVRSGAERQHDVGCYPEIAASPAGSAAISRPGTCSALSADDAS